MLYQERVKELPGIDMICGQLEDKNDMEEDSEEKLFEKMLNLVHEMGVIFPLES